MPHNLPLKRRPLTQRQERFCLEFVKSGDTALAMVTAGYSPTCAARNADKLRKNTIVQKRLAELNAKIESKTISTAMERREILTRLQRGNCVRPRDVVAAISEHNKMEHVYEVRVDGQVEVTQTFVFVLPDGTRVNPGRLIEAKSGNSDNV